jgi:hypothetical protein
VDRKVLRVQKAASGRKGFLAQPVLKALLGQAI